MERFSIDEVGGPFRADISTALDGMAGQLAQLHGAPSASGAQAAAALLGALDDGCHTIAGSSSLVGADGLTASALTLRELVEAMEAERRAQLRAAHRLQLLAARAATGLTAMARLLDLELAKDRAGADAVAGAFAAAAALPLAELDVAPARGVAPTVVAEPAGPPPDDEAGYAFADETAPPPVAGADDGDGYQFPEEPGAPASAPAPAPVAARTAAPPAPAPAPADQPEAEVVEAFAQEAGELLDSLDRHALALDQGGGRGALTELLRAYHTLKGSAQTVGLAALGALAHRVEDLLEGLRERRTLPAGTVPLLLRVQRALRAGLAPGGAPDLAPGELEDALRALSAADGGERAAPGDAGPASEAPAEAGRWLRIAASHLDGLMHLAGELVIGRARLGNRIGGLAAVQRELSASRTRLLATVEDFRARHEFSGLDGGRARGGAAAVGAGGAGTGAAVFTELELDRYDDVNVLARALAEISGDIGELQGGIDRSLTAFDEDAEAMGRVISGIQNGVMRARLVPVGGLFMRLHVAVRETAERLGKGVRVVTAGEEVALDKALTDAVHGPLLHLVRNAIAHGIEQAETRLLAGKSPDGTITLAARQEAGEIVITVGDDGAGLDLAALRRRGVELGLIAADTPDDSDAVRDLVFAAGLSTQASADAVSGRGYGCDAARHEIQRLGGTVRVAALPTGGTCFTVNLPLTLAISRALLVVAQGRTFAVPMHFIERLLDLGELTATASAGAVRIPYAGRQLVLRDLVEVLGLAEQAPAGQGPALVLRLGDQRWALRVDALLRQEEIVIGSLGELLASHALFSGAAIAGDGTLIPVIDVPGLLQQSAIVAPPPPPVPAPLAPPPAALDAAAGGPRVLYVDDSLSVRKVAERHLRELGAVPTMAGDGAEALARLRAGAFDLVFTDLEMPRLNGYELLREIRATPGLEDLPVVVVSSRSADKHRALAPELGASAHLPKPFTAEMLQQALVRWAKKP